MADGDSCTVDSVEELRCAANAEDENGKPLYIPVDPSRPLGKNNPPRRPKGVAAPPPRPSRQEVERRIAESQLWLAERLPMVIIIEKARTSWGIQNTQTVNRYLNLARDRMVEDLISDRKRHTAEQIYALNELARKATNKEQYNAAVGAFRVIAEIGGILRAPQKAPDSTGGSRNS